MKTVAAWIELAGILASPPASLLYSQQQIEIAENKRELLRLIADLKPKLPPELARRLAIISMKIATGWCSPYLTEEFERDVNARPGDERRQFEKEWKRVQAHEAWPRLEPPKPADESPDKKPT